MKCFMMIQEQTAEEQMKEFLDEVESILKERKERYGDMAPCFEKIATYWSAYLSDQYECARITPSDVCKMMMLMKIARTDNGLDKDCALDIIGYSLCALELNKK